MKNIQRNTLAFASILIILIMAVVTDSNASVREGDQSPNSTVKIFYQYGSYEDQTNFHDYINNTITVLAFIPSIQSTNEYADVMTASLQAYILQALGFDPEQYYNSGKYVNVIVATRDNVETVQQYAVNNQLDLTFADNSDGSFGSEFGVIQNGDNASATVMVIDENKQIVHVDEYYRGEGEKLQTVMSKLNKLIGIEETLTTESYGALYEGDPARDFIFDYVAISEYSSGSSMKQSGALSDYIGKKNIILGFYPAPFSMGCGMELTTFDYMVAGEESEVKMPEEFTKDLEVFMVSNESTDMLSKWFESMSFKNVKLISDLNADISAKYNSFNFFSGYNNRTIFLIDKQGVVRYIDWDYNVVDKDLKLLQEEIKKLDA
ncbi:MAG TPA: redoxin domain-containing protein [Ignavibacteria bacterium]|nr:redoxin domain-containing protein [Ignavibacteria bacterium]